MTATTTRFAPSPTGRLHVGNIRAALHNFLWARKHGGKFLLRIDDTDAERSTEAFVEAIRSDLAWLGLQHDGETRQSARFALYETQFERLKAAGRVYPAYETPQELDLKRKVQLGRGLPPIYDRAALTEPAPGDRAPHWRFKLDHAAPIAWTDLVRGDQHIGKLFIIYHIVYDHSRHVASCNGKPDNLLFLRVDLHGVVLRLFIY